MERAAVSISSFVRGCSADERAAHVVAVQRREVAVQDDDVVGHDARLVERRGAVRGDVHGHALAPQPAGHRGGDAGLVLGDQDAHGRDGRRAP